MGRKIPGRKHRGVKDPLKQIEDRNAKINYEATPSNPNDQEIPKSIKELGALIQKTKDGTINSRKKTKRNKKIKVKGQWLLDSDQIFGGTSEPVLKGMKATGRKFPKFVQGLDETDETFLHRINVAADEIIKGAQIENKHDVKINHDAKGRVSSVSKNEEGAAEKKVQKLLTNVTTKAKNSSTIINNKMVKKPKMAQGDLEKKKKVHLNAKQRKKLKKKMALHEEQSVKDFSQFKDHVKFGEVAHRPPTLEIPRKAQPRSNKVKGLLLTKMVSNKPTLSMASRKKQEEMRLEAVAAYRQLKQVQKSNS